MLPGVCPGCGLRADLDVFCAQAEVKQALAAALELPASLAGRVLRYLRLFSPANKTLALSKTARLLAELAEAVRSAQVTRRGVTHVAPVELWGAALDVVLNQPPDALPLTGHGYLYQVAWNLAERSAVRREQSIDERLRQGRREAPSPPVLLPGRENGGEAAAPEAAPVPVARPVRIGPPADFKALAARLIGVGQGVSPPTPTPTPTPTHEE